MAIENASVPDELDASLPKGTDFKKEGDNHLRVIKTVIKNALQGILRPATQAEMEEIVSPANNVLTTPLRVYQQVTARLATQAIGEGGSDHDRLMTSLRTKQYVDNRLAAQATAEGGTDAVKLMHSLAVKQYVDARLADLATAEAMTDNVKLITSLRGGQIAQKKFDNNYAARVASQAQSDNGTADNVTVTPLKARVTSDGRYLRLAQTTTFTRSLLDDADAEAARTTLGLGNAAVADLSSSTTSTSTTTAANSAAVREAFLSDGVAPSSGMNYLIIRGMMDHVEYGGSNDTWKTVAAMQMSKAGSCTFYVQHRSQYTYGAQTSTRVRILKNGSQIGYWTTTSTGYVARSVSTSINPGDYITLETWGSDIYDSFARVRYFRAYSSVRTGFGSAL